MFKFLIAYIIITAIYLLIGAALDTAERICMDRSQKDILNRIRARDRSEDPAERQEIIRMSPKFQKAACGLFAADGYINFAFIFIYLAAAQWLLLGPIYHFFCSFDLPEVLAAIIAITLGGAIGVTTGILTLIATRNLYSKFHNT